MITFGENVFWVVSETTCERLIGFPASRLHTNGEASGKNQKLGLAGQFPALVELDLC